MAGSNQDTRSGARDPEAATSAEHAPPPGGRYLDVEVVGGVTIARLRNRASSPSQDKYADTEEMGGKLYRLGEF